VFQEEFVSQISLRKKKCFFQKKALSLHKLVAEFLMVEDLGEVERTKSCGKHHDAVF